MTRKVFDVYIQTQLAPTLIQGEGAIMDDLAAHKSPVAEQYINERGAWLLFLPPCSPELNPIESASNHWTKQQGDRFGHALDLRA